MAYPRCSWKPCFPPSKANLQDRHHASIHKAAHGLNCDFMLAFIVSRGCHKPLNGSILCGAASIQLSDEAQASSKLGLERNPSAGVSRLKILRYDTQDCQSSRIAIAW